MDAIAENLANAQTTRTAEGGPYRRKVTTFAEVKEQATIGKPLLEHKLPIETTHEAHLKPSHRASGPTRLGGVEEQVSQDDSEPRWVYDPDHPDANADGYVAYPNVEVVTEMVDLITASRAYEANVTAINAAKAMNKKALEI